MQDSEARVIIWCDGLSALERSFDITKPIKSSNRYNDLLSGMQGILKTNNERWEYEHVMGHQLDTGKKLDRWEILNEEMDQRAKDYWQ